MDLLNGVIVCATAMILIGVAVAERRNVASRGLALFRALLPSWRFFEEIAPAPQLLCRFGGDDGELGAWQPLLQPRARTVVNLLVNPEGNLRLACHSVLEHLQSDLEALTPEHDPAGLVAYQLVQAIVLDQLATRPDAHDATRFQFCIAQPLGGVDGADRQPFLISEIHERVA